MKILTDDLKIFEILATAKLEVFDPTVFSVFEFSNADVWHLFLFNPTGLYKGCRLYILEKSKRQIDLREKLLPELINLPNDHGYFPIKNEALKVVESFISLNTSTPFFYDAH